MGFFDDIFGDSSPQGQPTPIAYPSPPSLLELATKSAQAAQAAAPINLATNQSVLPQMAQLQTDIMGQQAPQQAGIYAAIQQMYGPQLSAAMVNNAKTIDPTGFANRELLGQNLAAEAAKGGALTDRELSTAQNRIRSGMVARGGGTGIADAIKEAGQLGMSEFERGQQRNQALQSFINGRTVQGLGQVEAPVNSPNVNQFATQSIDPGQFMGAELGNYQSQLNNITNQNNLANEQYQYKDQNTTNPFLEGLSAFGGFAGPILGGVMSGGMTNLMGGLGGAMKGSGPAGGYPGYPKAKPITGGSL